MTWTWFFVLAAAYILVPCAFLGLGMLIDGGRRR